MDSATWLALARRCLAHTGPTTFDTATAERAARHPDAPEVAHLLIDLLAGHPPRQGWERAEIQTLGRTLLRDSVGHLPDDLRVQAARRADQLEGSRRIRRPVSTPQDPRAKQV